MRWNAIVAANPAANGVAYASMGGIASTMNLSA